MSRYLAVFACLAGCVAADSEPDPAELDVTTQTQAATAAFSREHVTADIYHYELVLPVGDGPNAAIRIHRVVRELAPYVARPTPHAVALLHGDFSPFTTSFAPTLGTPASPAPGLAPYLAARGVDVWGVDRRWTLPAADGDISDLATMGLAQEVDDTRAALAFARAVRLLGGSGGGRLALLGFSHGSQLAYAVAGFEGGKPAAQRHVDAVVAMDWWGAYGPDQEAERQAACDFAAAEYQSVADGAIDVDNGFFISIGQLALDAPDDLSPWFGDRSNRAAMLTTLGKTWAIGALFTPHYHLIRPVFDGTVVVGFADTSEAAAASWIAGATPHQALLETADFDQMLCGEAPLPIDAPLSRIHVPVLYVGAAGGVGALGTAALDQVGTSDTTALIIEKLGADQRVSDYGHSDLLFADDAATLVWQPLTAWLKAR
jgi:hypothetical protein